MAREPPAGLAPLRQSLKQALASTPRDSVDLRRGLSHAIRAIERAEAAPAKNAESKQ